MKTALPILTALLGSWFWRQPAKAPGHSWPDAVPSFAGAVPAGFCATLRNGTSFASTRVAAPAHQVLADARRAYAEAGWTESPVRARDMLLFTRGEAVAAVLVQDAPDGARVTVLQRPRGL